MENTKGMEKDTVQQTDEIEIDLWEICLVLIHNLALIISVGIMAALVAFLATQLFGVPKYESTTKIYILNKQENNAVTYSDIQLGTQLTKDYAELIQSRFVLEEVVQGMGLDLSYEEMKKKSFGDNAHRHPYPGDHSYRYRPGDGDAARQCHPGSRGGAYHERDGYPGGECVGNCKYAYGEGRAECIEEHVHWRCDRRVPDDRNCAGAFPDGRYREDSGGCGEIPAAFHPGGDPFE